MYANGITRVLRITRDFYIEGFRSMDIGKTLWKIVLIKLFIMFAVLRLFFFPDFLGKMGPEQKADYVLEQLTDKPQTHVR